MAITVTVDNGCGIDVAACLADVDATFSRMGFGAFSTGPTDFSGNQCATTERPNLIPASAKQSVVFESGGGRLNYSMATLTVSGTGTTGTGPWPVPVQRDQQSTVVGRRRCRQEGPPYCSPPSSSSHEGADRISKPAREAFIAGEKK
jgi:hypothetical protein